MPTLADASSSIAATMVSGAPSSITPDILASLLLEIANGATNDINVVSQTITDVVDGAPAALDTLNELAAALTDDANYAATVTAALALKVASSRQVLSSGLASGGGDLSADRTITVTGASQSEAEAGSLNTVSMTPLRTAQAIAALAPGVQGVKADIRALALIIGELYGDRIDLPNGWFDAFADFDDVDTAGATNVDTGVAGRITSGLTYGADLMTTGNGIVSSSSWQDATVLGDDAFGSAEDFWISGESNAGINGVSYVGANFGSPKHIRKMTIRNHHNGDTTYSMTSVLVQYSDDGAAWTTHSTVALAASTALQEILLAESGAHSHWRLLANASHNGSGRWGVGELEMMEASPGNLDVDSNSFVATTQPDTARLTVQAKENEAIVLNTDLIGSVSRDGGTTWTTATLIAESSLSDGTTIYVHDGIDISGQPAGTNMQWRVQTANNKDIEIHGVMLRWG